ncbi:MarR family winged helix-turn-helix transcriptional regulator [Cloacibacterium sp.]|uniref:MarR family winged helix-turn-helix transcriptional regulator n=1 Tax=Cloacibacterium sp. TaxID=1913682 RepID=UPI0039E5F224
MNYLLLKEVIENLEQFDQEKNSSSIEDFRIWMNEKAYQKVNPTELFKKENQKAFDLENEIAKQVILLGRFTKQMIRRGLKEFPQLANEEFTYLYRLMDEETLTKMQLVERNAHEKQTGMEIIKRLVKNKLVEEFPDKNDKRTTRLKLTELGKNTFLESIKDVTTTSRVLSAKLEDEEKENLLAILRKLNEFHFHIYQEYKTAEIDEINSLI